jgi:5-deoxy-glucuronate isomerase
MPASTLLVRGADVRDGEVVHPPAGVLKFIDFHVVRLPAGARRRGATNSCETALVLIGGSVNVSTPKEVWRNVGKRVDPFDGPPSALYLPPATDYEMEAVLDAEIAVCAAPGGSSHKARLLEPPASAGYLRGEGHAQRRIFDILMDESGAHSLFLTEVVTFAGNWSSYPPHKHDSDNPPLESQLEELYYYRAHPKAGFAFQRVYTHTGDLDETITAHDTDVVLVPKGYHVCAAAANYTIYYLNVLAGPKHVYRMTFDPAHEWVKRGWKW